MSIESEITVGTIVIVKVGRNEVEVTVTEATANGWKVKSQKTGREFEVRRIERVIAEPAAEEDTPEIEPETEPEEDLGPETAEPEEDEEDDNAVNPAPESGRDLKPPKKISLLTAAAMVLAACRKPMNCKEIIAKATEMGIWTPTGAKTPEQTLYGGIFRELKTTEKPRFKKSETRKGAFEYAQEK